MTARIPPPNVLGLGRAERTELGSDLPGLQFVTLGSPALDGRGDLTLYVPPGCEALSDLPVAVLLHGVHNSHWAWAFRGGAHRTAARLITQGRLPPMVLVMPSDGLRAEGSGYLHLGSGDVQRWIVNDVRVGVTALLPQVGAASKWFIGGFSMGGWGALRLGGRYPDLFAGISAHSAITTLGAFEALLSQPPCYLEVEPQSVLTWLERAGVRLPPLRFDCGKADRYKGDNRRLHTQLLERGVAHDYTEFPGGHNWAYWAQHLEQTLIFFGQLAGRRPSPSAPALEDLL